jgi:methionyl-tRNA formyltransferase
MDVVEWTALESGVADPGIGVTVHYMDEGVDTGAILARHRTELKPGDDFAAIRRRMERDMARVMVQCVRDLRDRKIEPEPQKPGDGRQYFVMHPALLDLARRRLKQQLMQQAPGGPRQTIGTA